MRFRGNSALTSCAVFLGLASRALLPFGLRAACGLSLVSLAMLAASYGSAAATAMVSVRAIWDAEPYYYADADGNVVTFDAFPDGITLSCVGGASGLGMGCSDERSVWAQNSSSAIETLSESAVSGVALTNSTQETFPGFFVFYAVWSAFNPGGPEIGASVMFPSLEYAAFSSQIVGPAEIGDFHSCDTRNFPGQPDFLGDGGFYFSPYAFTT